MTAFFPSRDSSTSLCVIPIGSSSPCAAGLCAKFLRERSNSANAGVCTRHCNTEFMKHVLPRFTSPEPARRILDHCMRSSSLGKSSSWLRVLTLLPPGELWERWERWERWECGDLGDREDCGSPRSSLVFCFLFFCCFCAIPSAASNSTMFRPVLRTAGRAFSNRAGTNSKRFNVTFCCDLKDLTINPGTRQRKWSTAIMHFNGQWPTLNRERMTRTDSMQFTRYDYYEEDCVCSRYSRISLFLVFLQPPRIGPTEHLVLVAPGLATLSRQSYAGQNTFQ